MTAVHALAGQAPRCAVACRCSEIRLLAADKSNLGVMTLDEALDMADNEVRSCELPVR